MSLVVVNDQHWVMEFHFIFTRKVHQVVIRGCDFLRRYFGTKSITIKINFRVKSSLLCPPLFLQFLLSFFCVGWFCQDFVSDRWASEAQWCYLSLSDGKYDCQFTEIHWNRALRFVDNLWRDSPILLVHWWDLLKWKQNTQRSFR